MSTDLKISIRAVRRKLKTITNEDEKKILRDKLNQLKKALRPEKIAS